MKLKIACLVLQTDRPVEEGGSKLRGYVGNKFPEYPILHHHVREGYLYVYPKVQYRVMGGVASILGIEEGAEILKEIMDELDELVLGRKEYHVTGKTLLDRRVELGPTRAVRRYRFLTPWLALNPQNYRKYRETREWKKRKELLNNILVGNVLSMCKGLGVVVERKLHAHTKIEERRVEYKGIPVLGMEGEFEINFRIPDLFGIGKGVSQGYGVVKSIA